MKRLLCFLVGHHYITVWRETHVEYVCLRCGMASLHENEKKGETK
jgi:Zn ribbon nucleic-acid-binding protein